MTPSGHATSGLLGARPWAACLLSAGLAASALAGPLADPTRPPTSASPAGNAAGNPAMTADTARGRPPTPAPAARAAPPPTPLPVLQSVRVPAQGAAVAMIDGQLVQAGDTVGDRVVKSIDPLGITLVGRGGTVRVLLLGGNPKQPPGSIATTHATRYEPAALNAADTPQRADRPGLALPSPTTPVPLSVAGRTAP